MLLAYLLTGKNSVIFVQVSASWSFFLGLPLFFFSFVLFVWPTSARPKDASTISSPSSPLHRLLIDADRVSSSSVIHFSRYSIRFNVRPQFPSNSFVSLSVKHHGLSSLSPQIYCLFPSSSKRARNSSSFTSTDSLLRATMTPGHL